jgi:glycosidase
MDVADLNYNSTEMRDTMLDAMEFWIYEANIDGFRCDFADGVPYNFWQTAWQRFRDIENRKFIFFAEGTRNDHFTAGFDLNFGWQSYGAIKNVFSGQPAQSIFTAHNTEYNNIPSDKHWIRFTTNHDESAWDATPVSLFGGVNGALAASVATIFTGGVPLIYGSQEVGTAQNIPFFSNSTINWNTNPQMLASYQTLLQFYSDSEVAKSGQNLVFPHNDVACFKKTHNGDELLLLINLRSTTIQYPIPVDLENTTWTDVMTGGSAALSGQLTLAPFQFYILDQ